tara:strand:+ start:258 stop:455 length:198 start_codon:yes stop_codon:yes gene_type:complete
MAKYKLRNFSVKMMDGTTNSWQDILNKEKGDKAPEAFSIPKDPANTDYQEYLEWVAAGNTPEAAD